MTAPDHVIGMGQTREDRPERQDWGDAIVSVVFYLELHMLLHTFFLPVPCCIRNGETFKIYHKRIPDQSHNITMGTYLIRVPTATSAARLPCSCL